MELLIRDAKPDDAAGIVAVFNPIIEARSYTLFDTPFSIEAERSNIAGLTSLIACYAWILAAMASVAAQPTRA